MDLTSGLRIARIRGIDIRAHWSWLLIVGLLAWSLSTGLFGETIFPRWSTEQRWAAGLSATALFFVSVLLHELSHALVAQRYGMVVPSITLFVFGGVSNLAGEMQTAGQEFRVAIAGPLMSWLLAIVAGGLWLLTTPAGVSAVFGYLAVTNAVLGVFNLLPGFPLDGGRVLRSLLWARSHDLLQATRVASRVGVLIAYGLIALGVIWVLAVNLTGLWYALVGLFLKSASEGSYAALLLESALKDVEASAVMRPAPAPVPVDLPLQRLIEEHVLSTADRAFLVERAGTVVGLITATDLVRVPREQRATASVEDAMVPVDDVVTIAPRTGVIEALRLMQEHDIHQLPVIDDGSLVGMLTRVDVMRQIELRTVLGERR